MQIKKFIKKRNGNLLVETNKGDYQIANNADNGQPYGICLPGHDFFSPITKGEGNRIYMQIIKEIEKNVYIKVVEEHFFSPSEEDSRFCLKCGLYLTDNSHLRDSNIHPLFEKIISQF